MAPKVIHSIFHPIEVVSCYREPQLQVGESYLYLFNLRPSVCKSLCLSTHCIPNDNDLNLLIKHIKNDYNSRILKRLSTCAVY